MIKRDTLVQATTDTVWQVTVPDGAFKGRPLAAYDANGDSIEWDSWQFDAGVLRVNFGIDPVVGELEYEYQGDTQPITDTSVITSDGGVVNITVNQYPKGTPDSQQ